MRGLGIINSSLEEDPCAMTTRSSGVMSRTRKAFYLHETPLCAFIQAMCLRHHSRLLPGCRVGGNQRVHEVFW